MFWNKFRVCIIVIFILFTINSCRPDDDDVVPINNTTNRLVGEWRCQEQRVKDNKIINFNVSIEVVGSDTTKIFINNFNMLGFDYSAIAVIQNDDIVIISNPESGYNIQGMGNISSNNKSIFWEYVVDNGNGGTSYKAEYTKL